MLITSDKPCISPVIYPVYDTSWLKCRCTESWFCIFYLVQFVGNKHLYYSSDVRSVCKNFFHCHKNTQERTLRLGNNRGSSLLCFPHAVYFLECCYDSGRCSCTHCTYCACTATVKSLCMYCVPGARKCIISGLRKIARGC